MGGVIANKAVRLFTLLSLVNNTIKVVRRVSYRLIGPQVVLVFQSSCLVTDLDGDGTTSLEDEVTSFQVLVSSTAQLNVHFL